MGFTTKFEEVKHFTVSGKFNPIEAPSHSGVIDFQVDGARHF
jgi:hypothetical protein